MNTTKHLLSMTDSQLKHCPPSVLPAFISTFEQRSERMAYTIPRPGVAVVVKDATGLGQHFPVCVLHTSMRAEPFAFQCVFSLC